MFNSRHKEGQGEFFADLSDLSQRPKKTKFFNLAKVVVSLSYENIIILSIGLIMLLIVCYSSGVERGKHFAQLKKENINIQQEKKMQNESKELPPKAKEEKVKVKVASVKKALKTSSYIQVASFRTDKYAREEIGRLKNKGYQPFLTKWGKFRVVCVGGYKNKDEAIKALRELRMLYADCILHNQENCLRQ